MKIVTICMIHLLLLLSLELQVFAGNQHPTISDVDRLLKDKRTDYNIYVRPKLNQSEPLVIEMGFDLIAIRDFDEVKERFSVVGTVYMVWKDERMPWVPADYGNLIDVIIERGDIWVPPLILVNSFDSFDKIGKDSYWPIRLHHSGYILHQPGQVFSITCSVNVELYPFDTQTCRLFFAMWGYFGREVTLEPYNNTNKVTQTYFTPNGEWDLIDTDARRLFDNIYGFQFIIKRKAAFIVVNTLVPITFMSILNTFAFLIPIDSGERISYCITVLLAVAVFLTIIADSLPQSATTIAVLSYYLVCVLGLSTLIILGSIVNMNIHLRDENDEVPSYWKIFVRIMKCRICRKSKRTVRYVMRKQPMSNETHIGQHIPNRKTYPTSQTIYHTSAESSTSFTSIDKARKSVNETNQHDMQKNVIVKRSKRMERESFTWKDVSNSLDRLFLIFSLIAVIVFTTTFFTYTLSSYG